MRKRALVLRYASMGDAIQASSPISELHDAGYEVTLLTSEEGEEVLRHDPHISHIRVMEPTESQGDYGLWLKEVEAGYDHIANLTGCVEGELATEPMNRNYYLPIQVRREIYGSVNYVERQHTLAQIPYT